jgi:hypothetical protein
MIDQPIVSLTDAVTLCPFSLAVNAIGEVRDASGRAGSRGRLVGRTLIVSRTNRRRVWWLLEPRQVVLIEVRKVAGEDWLPPAERPVPVEIPALELAGSDVLSCTAAGPDEAAGMLSPPAIRPGAP